ncbi:hypothetical protein GTY65_34645 [Streptomyces sp. SID8379]|uniref:hypothetical protein n=1 Tax=unclassified Streptomyces TaxID=2593676 RepID=UPI000382519E|nr:MULTISPECIES: hypothetical protein [unclassified Streptomyces]MYW69173.1 hypothetical protein [Streptomyces sp. SID8379]
MGATGWEYYVPYQADTAAALEELRERVFREGDYHWREGDGQTPAAPRPATIEELWRDEDVQEQGTHSILDMDRVLRPGEHPVWGTVQPVHPAEACRLTGTDVLTREHVEVIDGLVADRWLGRVAVLHDSTGRPSELYFWGFSGD